MWFSKVVFWLNEISYKAYMSNYQAKEKLVSMNFAKNFISLFVFIFSLFWEDEWAKWMELIMQKKNAITQGEKKTIIEVMLILACTSRSGVYSIIHMFQFHFGSNISLQL